MRLLLDFVIFFTGLLTAHGFSEIDVALQNETETTLQEKLLDEIRQIRQLTSVHAYAIESDGEENDKQLPQWLVNAIQKGEDEGMEDILDKEKFIEEFPEYAAMDDAYNGIPGLEDQSDSQETPKGGPEGKSGDYGGNYEYDAGDKYHDIELELPGGSDDYDSYLGGNEVVSNDDGDVIHEFRVVKPDLPRRPSRRNRRRQFSRRRRVGGSASRSQQRSALKRQLILKRLEQVRQMKRELQARRLSQNNPQRLGYDNVYATQPPPTPSSLGGYHSQHNQQQPYQSQALYPAPSRIHSADYYSQNHDVYNGLTDPAVLRSALEQAQIIANAVNQPYQQHNLIAREYTRLPFQYEPQEYTKSIQYETPQEYRHANLIEAHNRPHREEIPQSIHRRQSYRPRNDIDYSLPRRRPEHHRYIPRRRQYRQRPEEDVDIEYRTEGEDQRIREIESRKAAKRAEEEEEENESDDYDYYSNFDYKSSVTAEQKDDGNNEDYDYEFDDDVYGAIEEDHGKDSFSSSLDDNGIQTGVKGTGGLPPPPKKIKKAPARIPILQEEASQSVEKEVSPESSDWTTIYGDKALQDYLNSSTE